MCCSVYAQFTSLRPQLTTYILTTKRPDLIDHHQGDPSHQLTALIYILYYFHSDSDIVTYLQRHLNRTLLNAHSRIVFLGRLLMVVLLLLSPLPLLL
jgi:hypothetical protein